MHFYKLLPILFVSCLFWLITPLHAQQKERAEPTAEKSYFHMSPTSILASRFKIGYERLVNGGKNGVWITPAITYSEYRSNSRLGGSAECQYRFYLKNPRYPNEDDWKDPHAVYLAPMFMFRYLQVIEEKSLGSGGVTVTPDSETNINIYSIGLMAGVKYEFMHYFVADIYLGAQMRRAEVSGAGLETLPSGLGFLSPEGGGVLPRIGFTIGVNY